MTAAEFLRAELAPTPARVRATARALAACLVLALVVATTHAPHGTWAIFTAILVAQADAGASLRRAAGRLAGTLIGGGAALLAIGAFADQPWFMLPSVGAVCGLALYVSRRLQGSYAALLAGVTFALLVPDLTTAQGSIDTALWRILMIAVGCLIGTAAQLFLWPVDPEALLIADFAAELGHVGGIAARAAAGEPPGRPEDLLSATRLGRQLELLANTEARYPGLRLRHAELAALASELDRLLAAALWLARSAQSWDDATRRRVAALAAECDALGRALIERRPLPSARVDEVSTTAHPAALQMQRALAAIPAQLGFLGPHAARRSSLDVLPARATLDRTLQPADREDVLDAIRVGIGTSLCTLIVHALAWPGISTCVVTCLIVVQSSFGASARKSVLRLAGALLGALLGIATVVFAMPNLVGVGGWLVVFGLGLAVACWITTGGPRIAYAGVQTALALSLYMVGVFGPTTELVPGRDRVIGIVIGIAVQTFLARLLWPSDIQRAMRARLAAALRALAELSRVGTHAEGEALVEGTRGLRLVIYQQLGAVLALEDDAWAEPGAGTRAAVAQRRALRNLLALVEELFLAMLAVARHRIEVDLASALASRPTPHLRGLAQAVAGALEVAARRLERGGDERAPDLAGALESASAEAREQIEALRRSGDAVAAGHLEARLALYRALEPVLQRVVRSIEVLPPLPAARASLSSGRTPQPA